MRALEKTHGTSRSAPVPWLRKSWARSNSNRRRAETEVVRVWNQTIDPTITGHAQPAGIRRGTLFVSVDSSVWLDEIVRYRRHEILQRMQHAMGREFGKENLIPDWLRTSQPSSSLAKQASASPSMVLSPASTSGFRPSWLSFFGGLGTYRCKL
ncbi:MAG: hypothetical protein CM1200mP29_02320 [Verrucomicrobiota bacterium]|nr:MAG: hypothetical protein CM1200mP29_02320 [Verrucomicrobiota bacterium]